MFRQAAETNRLAACAPQNFRCGRRTVQQNASTQRGSYSITFYDDGAAEDWPRQLILFSLDSMGWAVAFRLGGTSIVSTVESHLRLVKDLWLAVDEVIHHDDVMLRIIVRSWGNVAGRDPNRRDAGVVKLDAEKRQVSIARRGRNETAE